MDGSSVPKPEPENDFEDSSGEQSASELVQPSMSVVDYGQQEHHSMINAVTIIKTKQTEVKSTDRKRKADDWSVKMEDDKKSKSDNIGAGRQKIAALEGYLVPKLEEPDEKIDTKQQDDAGKLKSTLIGIEMQEYDSSTIKIENNQTALPVDIHEALLDFLMHLTSTGVFVTDQQQLVYLVKCFLDKRQVTVSSFPDNQPPEEWLQRFLGQYRRRLLAVQKNWKREEINQSRVAGAVSENAKPGSRWGEWPQDLEVSEVLLRDADQTVAPLHTVLVEDLDESEEVAFVTKLIRADRHYVTGLLPTLLKNYLDERKITVRSFHGNLPSADYMNGFLRRHNKYLSALIQQPAPTTNAVTTIVSQNKVVNSGLKEQGQEGLGPPGRPLVKDGKLTVDSKQLLQMPYSARLSAAVDAYLSGEFATTTSKIARMFFVREDSLLDKIASPKQNYQSRLNSALNAVVLAGFSYRTMTNAAVRFQVHPEALLTRVHEHNRENVAGDRRLFAITPKIENAFVKTLVADGVVRQRQELPALMLAFFDKQGIQVHSNLSLEEWSKTVVLKQKMRLNELITE